ncbi:MAG: hypothetical protein K2M77_03540 [Muribaculaceae bacterium]|nr:hypothetical protein [Muribaculaceae bacterium]
MSTVNLEILMSIAVIIIVIAMYFSYNNKEIALRKESEAQRGKIETVRDCMFQIIREQANVSSEYREAFNEIYPKIIAGRYRDGGKLMKWIQEANPQFDISLYQTVSNSIEVQRTTFTSVQNRMLDIINQRATLIESYPSRWFIRNKSVIDYIPISTSATKVIMSTGVDDYTFSYK